MHELKNLYDMERVYRIQDNPVFRETLNELEEAEKDRFFCRHTLEHFLDVARLMQIEALESGIEVRKDVIYAAALTHDLGRLAQIKSGIPHDLASAELIGKLLPECGYTEEEVSAIREAVLAHRGDGKSREGLAGLLYRADKGSRNCYHCPAAAECNWSDEKRTKRIQ